MKLFFLFGAFLNFIHVGFRLMFGNGTTSRSDSYVRYRKLVDYAWHNIPAYRRLWEYNGFEPSMFRSLDDVKRIPIIDKDFVRSNYQDMIPRQYDCRRLSKVTTGGTTGMPMAFYIDQYKARSKELAYQLWGSWHFWKHIQGIDRIVTMRGHRVDTKLIESGIFWERNPRENGIFMSSFHILDENYHVYLEKLRDFRPKFIKAYPSSIVALCLLMKSHGDKGIDGLKGVICSSENIYAWQRDLVRDILDVEIYSFYGHSEKAVCAFQNSQGNMEFPSDYGYVEFLDDQGQDARSAGATARVVATSFDNFYFPFIRYNTGDYVEVASNVDKCARRIIGREQEFVYDSLGNKVIFTCSDEPIWDIDGIVAYQYHQRVSGVLELHIQTDGQFDCESISIIVERARMIFVNFKIEVMTVPEIARTPLGKYRYLIQHIK